MKISKRVREEAADACAIMASDRANTYGGSTYYFEIVGLSKQARKVAEAAHTAARPHIDSRGLVLYHLEYAEAEAMLRTGWTP